MDQRGFLSSNDTRCILVFFENTIANFDGEPSFSRRMWFENFREYLGFSSLRFSNSKKMNDVSERLVFYQMNNLKSTVKTWLIECAIDMITSDDNFDSADINVTATRISEAFEIPESDFYHTIISKTAGIGVKKTMENEQLEATRNIYYSKYKTTGLLYSSGEFIFSLYPNDTVSIYTADLKLNYYDIESLYEDRNDRVFIVRSHDSGMVGEIRLKPMGKAELSFSGKTILKLKI